MFFKTLLFLTIISFFISCEQPNVYQQGKEIYINNCSQCHGIDGKGLNQLIPPIAGSDFYVENKNSLVCIIRDGLTDSIVVNGISFKENMPSNLKLNNVEICNLINYINFYFYNDDTAIHLKQVTEQLKDCKTH